VAKPKKQATVNLVLRLPSDLHKQLVQLTAGQSPRNSLNREIVERLYWSVKAMAEEDELRVRVAALEAQMREGK
jgi:hypothetical protein